MHSRRAMHSRRLGRGCARLIPVLVLLLVVGRADGQVDFVRGDVDTDGAVRTVVDAAALASFFGGGTLGCHSAADIDDDGILTFGDFFPLLDYTFDLAGFLPAPHPDCGPDPTADALGCASFGGCGSAPTAPLPDPMYALSLTDSSGAIGGQADVTVTFDNTGGDVAGWAFGVCHDAAAVEPLGIDPQTDVTDLAPDYAITQIEPGLGWGAAVLISFDASVSLGVGNYALYVAHYDILGPSDSSVQFCATGVEVEPAYFAGHGANAGMIVASTLDGVIDVDPLDGPFIRGDVDANGEVDFIVDTAFLSAALFSAGPVPPCMDAADFDDDGSADLNDVSLMLNAGFVAVAPIPPPYPDCGLDPTLDTLTCDVFDGCDGPPPPPTPNPDLSLGFSPPSPDGDVDVNFGNDGGDIAGWSFGVCHDPSSAAIISVTPGPDLTSLNPDFEIRNLLPGFGWNCAALLSFTGGTVLGPGDYQLYTANYDTFGSADSPLNVCGGLGDPPVPISFAGSGGGGGGGIVPVVEPGTVDPTVGDFVRGDSNADGVTNLADSIYLINFQFQGGPVPSCLRSGDANDDGTVNIADAIWLINYFFLEGPLPPTPFPACGADVTPDSLGCLSYPAC